MTASHEVTESLGAPAAAAPAGTAVHTAWRWRPSRAAYVAVVMGLIVTAALALTSLAVYNRNERRLLNLRVREPAQIGRAHV